MPMPLPRLHEVSGGVSRMDATLCNTPQGLDYYSVHKFSQKYDVRKVPGIAREYLPGIFLGFMCESAGDFIQLLDGGNISPRISLGCPPGACRGDLPGCPAGPLCGDRRIGPW